MVELLVVVAIIGIIAALAIPAAFRAIDSSRREVCASNLRQIFVALQSYAADNDQNLPTLGGSTPGTWEYYLRPYISGYNQYGGTLTGNGGHGVYICPAWESRLKGISSAGQYGLNGYFYNSTTRLPGVKLVGISKPTHTILAGDMCYYAAQKSPFGSITAAECPGTSYGLPAPEIKTHANGAANILFCDGHVEYWPDSTILSQPAYSNRGAQDVWNFAK